MKKPLLLLLFSAGLFACSPNANLDSSSLSSSQIQTPIEANQGESMEYTKGTNLDSGRMIEVKEVRASSELFPVSHLIDRSGMSGNNGYSQTHTSANQRETMYISNRGETTGEIVFTFDGFVRLGSLYLWNYNQNGKLECGVERFEILYSEDGFHYHSLGTHTLEKGKGRESEASRIDGLTHFSFLGIKAKSVKLIVNSNYGGTQFGLSEARFFAYQNEEDESLEAYSFLDSNSTKNSLPSIAPGLTSLKEDALLTNNPYYMSKTKRDTLTYSLRGQYPLKKITFWNYNDPDALDAGVKEIEISLSVDATHFDSVGTYLIPQGTGLDHMPSSLSVDLMNRSAQYVRFKFLSNYGNEGNYGLGAFSLFEGSGRKVKQEEEFTSLFSSYSSTWSGADGIFSTRLNGKQAMGNDSGKVLFNFSDTYVGEINPISKRRINNSMQNQSFGYLDGDRINFVTKEEGLPISATKDATRSEADAFYWLGDSFVTNNTYYVFGLYIAKEGALGFTQKGEDLFAFDIKDEQVDFSSFRNIYDTETNRLSYFSSDLSIIFGSAVFENTVTSGALNPDGYIYVYGYKDDNNSTNRRSLVVSRVKEEEVENLSKYTYFDGDNWVNDISKCASLTDNGGVSCELSVTEINDPASSLYRKFVLVYQDETIGKDVCLRVGDTPYSVFGEKEVLYHAEETSYLKNTSQYNAKAHPVLSSDGSLLISYNLNECGASVNNDNADIYHPRFISMTL